MNSSILKIFFSTLLCLLFGSVYADTEYVNVFTEALINGEARSPLQDQAELQAVVKHLQEQAQNSSPLIIQVRRVRRFQQQPKCGRIAFFITQSDSGSLWSDIGGQLNICEDGAPPQRVCANKPDVLISSSEKCSDNTEPQDTLEIKEAIRVALDEGGLNQEQVKNRLTKKDKQP